MFLDREDAAYQLAAALKGRDLHDPLVLAIPRGGVVIGAVLALELGAELDVVLSRKLRAPLQPELAVGAVAENGGIFLNREAQQSSTLTKDYLTEERRHQLAEIARRRKLFRQVRPPAPIAGRSVIVTDDGIATGSTMIAALQVLMEQNPRELIAAVPVASPERLNEISRWCDEVICLLSPEAFCAIGQFYADFSQVEDQTAINLLRAAAPGSPARAAEAKPLVSATMPTANGLQGNAGATTLRGGPNHAKSTRNRKGHPGYRQSRQSAP
jgi:putative phosphoribosyl transferase